MYQRDKNILKYLIICCAFIYCPNMYLVPTVPTFGRKTDLKKYRKFLYKAHSPMTKANNYEGNKALK